MTDCIGKYYARGISFHKTPFLHAAIFKTGTYFYEVLRVIEGSCIFLDDHLNRLNESLRLSGLSFRFGSDQASHMIHGLIGRNKLRNGNIRLMVQVKKGLSPVLFACCIPFSYPDATQYEQGVSTAIYPSVRVNPNVKAFNPLYQEQMSAFLSERNVYEALLTDDLGRITEGSRSNVFFISSDVVLTSPGISVLKGITRKKVISICKILNYKLIEKTVSIDDLNEMEAVFLTGTSPKVLPVCRIDNFSFAVGHPMMRNLIEAYEQMIRGEIDRNRRA